MRARARAAAVVVAAALSGVVGGSPELAGARARVAVESGTCTVSRTLRPTMTADDVLCLERRLRGLGELPTTYVNGVWGTATTAAVKRVQYYLSARGFPSGTYGIADATFLAAIGLAPAPPATIPTRCPRVGVIGDSLTLQGLPSLAKALRGHGVGTLHIAAHGGRGTFFHASGDIDNGVMAATWMRVKAVDCWIIAMGTNDVENAASGTLPTTPTTAITAMMNAIDPGGAAPVLWVNLLTKRTTGYFANSGMAAYNAALVTAQSTWPNLHIADWAASAPGGFRTDGVHLTIAGYATRAAFIVDQLATQLG